MTQHKCVQLDHVLQMYHVGYHKGHRPSSIRELLALRQLEGAQRLVTSNLLPKDDLRLAQVLHLKMLVQSVLNLVDRRQARFHQKKIVDVHKDDDDFAVIHKEVEAGFRVDIFEPLRLEEVVGLGVSHFGGLLQPIQRLQETKHLVRIRLIDIAVWLRHVDLLVKVTVKECRLDVYPMQLPLVCRRHLQDASDDSELGHRRERLVKFKPLDMPIAHKAQARPVPLRVFSDLVQLVLDRENQLSLEHAMADRDFRETPCLVLADGVHVLVHCGPPFG